MIGKTPLFYCLLFLVSCAHIESDPHFWPGSKHRLRRVPDSKVNVKNGHSSREILTRAPSLKHCLWQLAKNAHFSQREYLLTIRDEQKQIIDTNSSPELSLDGDVILHFVKKEAPGVWRIKLEFTKDQSVIKVGFTLGKYHLDGFKQVHFNLHEVDLLASNVFAFKEKIRADGQDALRVYLDIKDVKGHSIFSHQDFDIKLQHDQKKLKVRGPFSTSTGPYFLLTSTDPMVVNFFVTIDGERISGMSKVSFIHTNKRSPAKEKAGCLKGLASLSGTSPPQELDEISSYRFLARHVLRRYEERFDLSPVAYQKTLAAFSSESCAAHQIWDQVRDEAGRHLKTLHGRRSR